MKLQYCRASAALVTTRNLTRSLLCALHLAPLLVFSSLFAIPSQNTLANPLGDCAYSKPIFPWGTPTRQTCNSVNHEGLKVYSVYAEFQTADPICNWRYDVVFTDVNNKQTSLTKGYTTYGCKLSGNTTFRFGRDGRNYTWAKPGEVCSRLYQNGKYLDAACTSLY